MKFHTRSEAELLTQSLLHGAKRSYLHEVDYTIGIVFVGMMLGDKHYTLNIKL